MPELVLYGIRLDCWHSNCTVLDIKADNPELRTGVYDIPSQDVLTKDSISVCVNAVVFWRVVEPLLAVCGDGDYVASTHYKSQTVIRQPVQHSAEITNNFKLR